MFGSNVLDIALGMVFIFLILSLLVTAANELIANWFRLRATQLEEGLKGLLSDPDGALTQALYGHPLIDGLTEPRQAPTSKKPSYIPSRTFVMALVEVLRESTATGTSARTGSELLDALKVTPVPAATTPPISTALRRSLTAMWDEAGEDMEKWKGQLEVWFNNSMERVSGWYKRKTQWITLWLAAIAAVAMNVDSIRIAQTLANSPTLRASVAAQAEQFAKKDAEGKSAENAKDALKKLQDAYGQAVGLGLPIGWAWSAQDFTDSSGHFNAGRTSQHLLGWLITAVAASLGAPFWFDTLNKIINIRAAGKAPEEEPKTPKKVPPEQKKTAVV